MRDRFIETYGRVDGELDDTPLTVREVCVSIASAVSAIAAGWFWPEIVAWWRG